MALGAKSSEQSPLPYYQFLRFLTTGEYQATAMECFSHPFDKFSISFIARAILSSASASLQNRFGVIED
jgi:hypothetical protein